MDRQDKVKWVESCRICSNEVCSIVDHFVGSKQARSVREATKMISDQLDGEIPAETIRTIYNRKHPVVVSNDTKKSKPVEDTGIREHKEPEKPKDNRGGPREGAGRPPKYYPARMGMQFARHAVMKLEEIEDDDLERDQAFDYVQSWLNEKRGERGKQCLASQANHQGRPSGSKDPSLSLQ
jgi:hypothetical protein